MRCNCSNCSRELIFDKLLAAVHDRNYSIVNEMLSHSMFNRLDYHIVAYEAIKHDDVFLLRILLDHPYRLVPMHEDLLFWYDSANRLNSISCIKELRHYLPYQSPAVGASHGRSRT